MIILKRPILKKTVKDYNWTKLWRDVSLERNIGEVVFQLWINSYPIQKKNNRIPQELQGTNTVLPNQDISWWLSNPLSKGWWWMKYLLDIHEAAGFKRLISIVSTPDLLQTIRIWNSHRSDLFEAKKVLAEVISNETGVLAVEGNILNKSNFDVLSVYCTRYLYILQDVCPLQAKGQHMYPEARVQEWQTLQYTARVTKNCRAVQIF